MGALATGKTPSLHCRSSCCSGFNLASVNETPPCCTTVFTCFMKVMCSTKTALWVGLPGHNLVWLFLFSGSWKTISNVWFIFVKIPLFNLNNDSNVSTVSAPMSLWHAVYYVGLNYITTIYVALVLWTDTKWKDKSIQLLLMLIH